MEAWWAELTTTLRVFWGIAIFSTVFFVLQTIMTFAGLSDMDSYVSEKISRWIQYQLTQDAMKVAMIRKVKFFNPSEENQFEYLKPTGENDVFDATHRVMGISEIASSFF